MLYDKAYYQNIQQASESSAQETVPFVVGLMAPRSVLDVGCGDGTWLSIYQQNGVTDCLGVDGSYARDLLRISSDRFIAHDLAKPLDLGRRFDLVQSLEVAQHLPPSAAEGFILSLCWHGDAILFSAAIPHQGGTGHVNECWPDYWAELFKLSGFALYDCVRPGMWGNDRVAWWYAQNTLLFVREGTTTRWMKNLPRPALIGPHLRLVHPRLYLAAHRNPGRTEETPVVPTPSVVTPILPRQPRPYDVAVVIATIGRATLDRAVRSVFAQDFRGTIQIVVGIDAWLGPGTRVMLDKLVAEAPANRTVTVFDPGYSTSVRHDEVHPERCGGALRTLLSYLAHSRMVAYLDDDNWWAPDHVSELTAAVAGRSWAFTLRWYVDQATARPLCVDRWESVGPNAGCFRDRFGGWVDPNCLLIDKLACEPTLRLWSVPLPGDSTRLTGDRQVFADLMSRGPAGSTGRATAYYTLTPTDVMHSRRMEWITAAQTGAGLPASKSVPAPVFTTDWFTYNVPVWEQLLNPLAGRPIDALEIGVFEGRSAVWLLENVLIHPDSSLTWVDSFGGSAELVGLDLSGLEARFRANVARFGAKVTGHVGRSQEVLRGMRGERFDLIYIDGSHAAADVLSDVVLAWPLLRPGGLLGFDDYRWNQFPEPERCPGVAIDGFLAAHKGRYKEIHRGYQLWIQKIC